MVRAVTFSMSMSLDGYIVGPDGGFDWSRPDEELFAFATDEVRALGAHLLGRRLYETMSYWETAEQDPTNVAAELEFAEIWRRLPKVVCSRTLTSVEGTSTRLATGTLADEIELLKAQPGEGNIAIGGATLAAAAAALDLIDEYRIRVHPVLVGGGTPFFPRAEQRVDLELLDTRTFASQVVFQHYRVVR